MSRARATALLPVIGLLLQLSPLEAQSQRADVEELLRSGGELFDAKDFRRAVKAFNQAEELLDAPCPACVLGIAASNLQLGRHDRTAEAARRLIGLTDDAQFLIRAHNYLGSALFYLSAKDVPQPWEPRELELAKNRRFVDKMKEAESSFRIAVDLDGGRTESLRWNLATALEWLGRAAEANLLFTSPDALTPEELECLKPDASCDEPGPTYVNEDVKRPVKIKEVFPQYTYLARAARIEGLVILQTVIDTEGVVGRIRVLQGLPGLTAEAIKAVRQWRYQPAELDGKRVSVFFNLTVEFHLS